MKREREFLRLAGTWLAARWCVMGNDIVDGLTVHQGARDMHGLGWHLLGMVDYAAEMRVLCAEVRK
jgi:hypothetical protein